MKTNARLLSPGFTALLGLLVISHPVFGNNPSPTSKLYVADLEGQSEIDTGERIEDIREKSVHNAQGTIIETKVDSNNSLVFSNGTGIFIDPDTRLEVKRFVQEPFIPNRTDLETEPSISQTFNYLPRGRVGICSPKMVAGSSMVYATPHASVAIRGRKVVIESNDFETKVSSVEGSMTITGDGAGGSGRVVNSGQQAIITRLPGQAPTIKIHPIPDDEVPMVEDRVTMACNARQTVYFDVANKKSEVSGESPGDVFLQEPTGEGDGDEGDGDGEELTPVEVTPVEPPPEVIGSPSSI